MPKIKPTRIAPDEPKRIRVFQVIAFIGVLLVLIALVSTIIYWWSVGFKKALTPHPNPSSTASATPTPEPTSAAECATSWKMATSSHENNRWFTDGIAEIKSAKTPQDAAKAATVWEQGVRKDPQLLQGAVAYFLKDTIETSKLSDSNGCATEKAVQLSIQLELVIADAKSIVPDAAPGDGYNSGVDNGTVVYDPTPGIGGDRTAIKVTLPDGTVIWIMARCGNIVTPGSPPGVNHGKIQRENIGSNPAVDNFYQDGGDKHTISNGDGATVPNGNQGTLADVAAAQKAAEEKAAADNAAQLAAAEAARKAAEAASGGAASTDQNQGNAGNSDATINYGG